MISARRSFTSFISKADGSKGPPIHSVIDTCSSCVEYRAPKLSRADSATRVIKSAKDLKPEELAAVIATAKAEDLTPEQLSAIDSIRTVYRIETKEADEISRRLDLLTGSPEPSGGVATNGLARGAGASDHRPSEEVLALPASRPTEPGIFEATGLLERLAAGTPVVRFMAPGILEDEIPMDERTSVITGPAPPPSVRRATSIDLTPGLHTIDGQTIDVPWDGDRDLVAFPLPAGRHIIDGRVSVVPGPGLPFSPPGLAELPSDR